MSFLLNRNLNFYRIVILLILLFFILNISVSKAEEYPVLFLTENGFNPSFVGTDYKDIVEEYITNFRPVGYDMTIAYRDSSATVAIISFDVNDVVEVDYTYFSGGEYGLVFSGFVDDYYYLRCYNYAPLNVIDAYESTAGTRKLYDRSSEGYLNSLIYSDFDISMNGQVVVKTYVPPVYDYVSMPSDVLGVKLISVVDTALVNVHCDNASFDIYFNDDEFPISLDNYTGIDSYELYAAESIRINLRNPVEGFIVVQYEQGKFDVVGIDYYDPYTFDDFSPLDPPSPPSEEPEGILGYILYYIRSIIYYLTYPFYMIGNGFLTVLNAFKNVFNSINSYVGEFLSLFKEVFDFLPGQVKSLVVLSITVGFFLRLLGR